MKNHLIKYLLKNLVLLNDNKIVEELWMRKVEHMVILDLARWLCLLCCYTGLQNATYFG